MTNKPYLNTVDVALTAVFSALWIALNLTLGPLSFSLLQLPVLHDFGVFFTLLLVTWITGRFGPSLMVGLIGSVVAVLLGGPTLILGFAASAVLFDVFMFANHHKIQLSTYSLIMAAVVTLVSAYLAGVIIGVFFMGGGVQWALTVWGGWHLVGGVVAIAITLPIIVALEKANVRKIKGRPFK
jgi:hypothetical protein